MIRRSWHAAKVALQLLAEEGVGAPRRAEDAAQQAAEDAAFEATRKAVNAR